MRQLLLVRAVIVHHPDFLVAAAPAHEGDLRLRDAGLAAAEHRNDVVRKLVRELSRAGVRRGPAIDFLQREWSRGVSHIGKKSRESQIRSVGRQVAVSYHVSIGRGCGPVFGFQLVRLARHLKWIEARADQIENPRIFQIGPQNVVECFRKRLAKRGPCNSIRDRDARLRDAEAGACLEPVLRRSGTRRSNHRQCRCNH